jgi:protein involved in polysaccharide export with SLBB domain
MNIARGIATAVFAMLLSGLSACADSRDGPAPPASASANIETTYHLGTGDKLRVIVYGEDDLGGQYDIDSSGMVRLPLVGQVQAAGLTVRQFEQQVKAKLDQGYLKDARVSVEVTNYRPFYILGEVNKPGEYPYVNGMSVLTAVAMAGGYTYRANESEVYVRRSGSTEELSVSADQTNINPGDIIRVPERFF